MSAFLLRPCRDKALLFLSSLLITLVINSLRIALIALLAEYAGVSELRKAAIPERRLWSLGDWRMWPEVPTSEPVSATVRNATHCGRRLGGKRVIADEGPQTSAMAIAYLALAEVGARS